MNDQYEQELWSLGHRYICACDESGMGALAGDVYVAAVVLPVNIDYGLELPGINDSKQLSAGQRDMLYDRIKDCAVSYAIATASVEEIDIHNIYWARFIAARKAIAQLSVKPDYVLMDGNAKIPQIDIPQKAIVRGDAASVSIAAASVLAKVARDRYMIKLSAQVHQDFDWKSNKAYYCRSHIDALAKHGKTQWHRSKFIRKFKVKE